MSEIKTIGIAGCGTMGAGIAIVSARAGFRTIVYDTRQEALDNARENTRAFLNKSVQRGKLTAEQLEASMNNLVATTNLADMAECDLVIDAVFEDLRDRKSVV